MKLKYLSKIYITNIYLANKYHVKIYLADKYGKIYLSKIVFFLPASEETVSSPTYPDENI